MRVPPARILFPPEDRAAILSMIDEALTSGQLTLGAIGRELEEAFAVRHGTRHAVAVSSGTAALEIILRAVGVNGREVVVPANTFFATAAAATHAGARLRFVDCDPQTMAIDAADLARCLNADTAAVVIVHIGGSITPAIDEIAQLCAARGVQLVEDAAHAHGSAFDGRSAGQFGRAASFSFYPTKVMAGGEGGMIVTDDDALAARARRLREHGMSVSAADRHASGGVVLEQYLETGFNFRMTDIQAAVGLVQLQRLPAMVAGRREQAARYRALLADLPGIITNRDPAHGTSNYQSFWVLLPEGCPVSRNEVMQALVAEDISPRRGIMASHLEPAYADEPHIPLPVTERITNDSLILPLHHEVTAEDQERIVSVLASALEAGVPG